MDFLSAASAFDDQIVADIIHLALHLLQRDDSRVKIDQSGSAGEGY